jgi:hypothetical protein
MTNKIVRTLLAGGLALAFLTASTQGLCEEGDRDSEFAGKAAVGAHGSFVTDEITKVREFDLGREALQKHFWLDAFGRSGENRVDATLWYYDEATMSMKLRADAGPYVSTTAQIRSFYHWTDHDRLENLQWRESINGNPGGKMITHEDTDPNGTYGIRHTESKFGAEVKIPAMPATKIAVDFRDQRRHGFKQVRGVDHCSNCHVRARRRGVNEATRDVSVSFNTQVNRVNIDYEFTARRFDSNVAPQTNYYMEAQHPVKGDTQAEFGSRLIYDDVDLEFARTPETRKEAHAVKARADLPKGQSLSGSFSYSRIENELEKIEMKTHAGGGSWYAPLTKKVRVAASAMARKIKNDEVPIDLPLWREGRSGGGQDFDWTRMSAYDRREVLAGATANYKVRPGHNVRVQYRFRSTDRDNVYLDPDDVDETTTMQNKVKASWSGRLAGKARARASVEYEMTDHPFVALGGLCEHALSDTVKPYGDGQPNDFVYYWQRSRFGTGGNLPTGALRARANLNFSPTPKLALTGYVNIADEMNDEMNVYEWERTAISPGLSAYLMPNEKAMLSGGVAYSKIESNAKLCATVMDG